MKTGAVMTRRDCFGNLAFDFDSDVVGERELTVDTIGRDRKLRVVVVVGMDESAVGQSRETCGNFHSGSDDAGFGTGSSEFFNVLANQRSHWRDGPCQSKAEAVENRFPSQREHAFWNILILRIDDELGNVLGQPRYIWKLTGAFLRRQRRCCNRPKRTCNALTPFHARFLP